MFVLLSGWVYLGWKDRRAVKRTQAQVEQTRDLKDREMLETIYSSLVTADPTDLEPDPPPGLIDRVKDLHDKVDGVKAEQENVATRLVNQLHAHAIEDEKHFTDIGRLLNTRKIEGHVDPEGNLEGHVIAADPPPE